MGPIAAEQIGLDDDEAFRGNLVGHLFGPVTEAENLVDHDHDGGFVLDFGIDDEGLDGAVAPVERDIFPMARGGFEAGFGPVLRVGRDSEER